MAACERRHNRQLDAGLRDDKVVRPTDGLRDDDNEEGDEREREEEGLLWGREGEKELRKINSILYANLIHIYNKKIVNPT